MENNQPVNISASYAYNHNGMRVRASSTVNGIASNRIFLLDEMNHTGYAQILEESNNGSLVKSYVIGDDILSQSSISNSQFVIRNFLYDGHGSTRLLTDSSGAITSRYDYEAYGKMIGGDPLVTSPVETDILFSGEQFDVGLNNYYQRHRVFDQNTGRFNSRDDFAGRMQDPQSLHKYAYCHADPVNNVDPSGEFLLGDLLFSTAIRINLWATVAAPYITTGATIGMTVSSMTFLLSMGAMKLEAMGILPDTDIPEASASIAGWGLAISGTLLGLASLVPDARTAPYRSSPNIESPKLQARHAQATTPGYNPDWYENKTLKKGSVIYRVTYKGDTSSDKTNWYTDARTIISAKGDASKLKELLQVKYPKDRIDGYVVTKDTPVAAGITGANKDYGQGGGTQFYIPDKSAVEEIGSINMGGK